MSKAPLKIALFVATPGAIPTVSFLAQSGFLAGVVFPPHSDPGLKQLEQWLDQQQIRRSQLQFGSEAKTVERLRCWESDLIVAMGFSGEIPEVLLEATGLGYCDLFFSEPECFGTALPLYWLIHGSNKHSRVSLRRSFLSADKTTIKQELIAEQEFIIDQLDTYKCVENKATNSAALCVKYVLEYFSTHSILPDSRPLPDSDIANLGLPTDETLLIDFQRQTSQQILDRARAGNPIFNGCIVQLEEVALNLLQATKVDFATHGIPPGTICHIGEPEGFIVSTLDGAIRFDILANIDGIFSGIAFAERFQISVGTQFKYPLKLN